MDIALGLFARAVAVLTRVAGLSGGNIDAKRDQSAYQASWSRRAGDGRMSERRAWRGYLFKKGPVTAMAETGGFTKGLFSFGLCIF